MTTGICVVPVEGILAVGESADLRSAPPTKFARDLYEGLRQRYRMIAFTLSDHDRADWWLRREMMPEWAAIMTKPDAYNSYPRWRVDQVGEFLAEGWEVGLVLDMNADVTERLNEMGLVTMLLSYPTNRIGWKDQAESVRPWDEVSDYDPPHKQEV